jgi:hypothetical protein
MRPTALVVGLFALSSVIGGDLVSAEQRDGRAGPRASIDHPFSDPVFHPLRNPARIGCVNGNPGVKNTGEPACMDAAGNPLKHGYPAIDILGALDDPIYAAGAGIFHPRPASPDCIPERGEDKEYAGQYVWIDHGGGVVSRYQHLNTINPALKDGDLVTPGTLIGTMGHSGGDCDGARMIEYLHFEVRKGGEKGKRAEVGFGPKGNGVGSLYACVRGQTQEWPNAVDRTANNWNETIWHRFFTPASDSSCVPAVPATPDPPRALNANAGNKVATVAWSAPPAEDKVDHVTLETRIERPSAKTLYEWKDYPGTTTRVRLTGLTNGWTYKFRLYYHNLAGYSVATPWVAATPVGPPTAPTGPRRLTAEANVIKYAWGQSYQDGVPVTGYEVAIRSRSARRWSAWTITPTGSTVPNYRWDGLAFNTLYEVKVRATSTAGPSSWLGPNRIRTPAMSLPTTPGLEDLSASARVIRFNWTTSRSPDTPVTGYQVGIRQAQRDGWSAWSYATTPETSYRWEGLTPATGYQVRVRALSLAGRSDWLGPNNISTTE